MTSSTSAVTPILAVKLVSEMERRTGTRIPVAALLQGRTIEYVASVLADDSDSGSDQIAQSIVTLQSGGSEPTLFMIGSHPRYREIPRLLGHKQPVIQIDMYAALSERKRQGLAAFTRIQDYAAYFLEQIVDCNRKAPTAWEVGARAPISPMNWPPNYKGRGKK